MSKASHGAPSKRKELAEEPAIDGEPTADSATDVDWAAHWEKFGFDTPDAAGNEFASDSQLTAAVQSSDRNIAGDAEGHIDQGVDDSVLIERYTDGGTLPGYTFVGGKR